MKTIKCASRVCNRELSLDDELFGITEHEDGTWSTAYAIHCSFCHIVFAIDRNVVSFEGVRYPNREEYKILYPDPSEKERKLAA